MDDKREGLPDRYQSDLDLRLKAEEVIKRQKDFEVGPISHERALALVHELQVHQIELEMQNDELERARQTAEELRDRYIRLYDFAPIGYVTLDQSGTILLMNLCASLILSSDRQTLLGSQFRTHIHSNSIPIFNAFRERALLGGRTEGCDLELSQRSDPSLRYIHIQGRVRSGEPGTPLQIFLSISNVTERKQAEMMQRESEERYKTLLQISPDPICLINFKGVFLYTNDSAATLFGYTDPDELSGVSVEGLIAPKDKIRAMKEFSRSETSRGVCYGEMTFLRRGGGQILCEVHGQAIHDSEGRPIHLLLVLHDITVQRRAEEALRQANKKLNLMSDITRHDILNQLMALQGFLMIASEKSESGDVKDVGYYLNNIGSIASTIGKQIQFTREYQNLGVCEPVWQCIHPLIVAVEDDDISITDDTGGLAIYADPLLSKVFENLMDNTIRHGEVVTRVRVWCRPEKIGGLTLIWEDNGVGIVADQKERIFDRGFGKNTGLGLFFTREILEITGISTQETGEPGNGARFELYIPHGAYHSDECDDAHSSDPKVR